MTNKMLDSNFCECGGIYQHVDQQQDDGGVVDLYQCDTCKTGCIVVWDPETEQELKREYSRDDDDGDDEDNDLFWGPDGHLHQHFYDDDFEDTCGAPDWADDVYRANEATDDPALGPCCACGKNGPTVRNIFMLHRLCPTPGRGWGCIACGLPADYASAVLCDACLEGPDGTGPAEIEFVCTGYPAEDGRTPIEQAPEVKVKHNPLYHPEMLQEMKFFDTSPDYGHPECLCSICGDPIPDPNEEDEDYQDRFIPLRLYRKPSIKHPYGQEARFCIDCGPAVLKFTRRAISL